MNLRAGKKSYMFYKDFFIRIKSCSGKPFFLTSSTCLVVGRASTIVYNLQLSSYFNKLISMLFNIKIDIYNTTSILMSISRKIPSKKQNLLTLSSIEKDIITILKISKLELLISQIQRPCFLVKVNFIVFILLPKLMRVWNDFFLN